MPIQQTVLTKTNIKEYVELNPSRFLYIRFRKNPQNPKWGEEHTAHIPALLAEKYIELVEKNTSLYANLVTTAEETQSP